MDPTPFFISLVHIFFIYSCSNKILYIFKRNICICSEKYHHNWTLKHKYRLHRNDIFWFVEMIRSANMVRSDPVDRDRSRPQTSTSLVVNFKLSQGSSLNNFNFGLVFDKWFGEEPCSRSPMTLFQKACLHIIVLWFFCLFVCVSVHHDYLPASDPKSPNL